MSITVFLADDHAVFRNGLRYLLEADPTITVVGTAANGIQAVNQVKKLLPDVVIMDMRAVSNIADYFVICSASSTRRVQAVTHGIEESLDKKNIRHWHIEGKTEALWVLIDYGDVIAHVFQDRAREFYNLERLWQDAPKESVSA